MRAVPLVLFALAVGAAVEISLLVLAARSFGGLAVVLALGAAVVVGAWVVRWGGHKAVRALRGSGARPGGGEPAVRAADTVLTVLAGVLLLVPGFVSDVFGLLLLVGPVRRVVARSAIGRLARRWLPPDLASKVAGPMRVRSERGSSTFDGVARSEPTHHVIIEGETAPRNDKTPPPR